MIIEILSIIVGAFRGMLSMIGLLKDRPKIKVDLKCGLEGYADDLHKALLAKISNIGNKDIYFNIPYLESKNGQKIYSIKDAVFYPKQLRLGQSHTSVFYTNNITKEFCVKDIRACYGDEVGNKYYSKWCDFSAIINDKN